MASGMATRTATGMAMGIRLIPTSRSLWTRKGINYSIVLRSCRSDIYISLCTRSYSSNKKPSEPITYSHPPEPPASLEKKREFFDPIPSPSPSSQPEQKNVMVRIWLKAKEFFIFYKNGIKQINTNRIQVNRIRKMQLEQPDFVMNREQYQLVLRTRQDLKRLVPFLLILLILEELLPLVVMYYPAMLPSTCVMPSQLEKMRSNQLKKRIKYLKSIKKQEVWNTLRQGRDMLKDGSSTSPEWASSSTLDPTIIKTFNGFLKLSRLGPASRLQRILDSYSAYLTEDDQYLIKEGLDNLPLEELKIALEERGLTSIDKTKDHLASDLTRWLELRKKQFPTPLMLTMSIFDVADSRLPSPPVK